MKKEDLNERLIERYPNAFWVLKRWNSFTPGIFESSVGGGYFLNWKGKGIVIDPGFDYLLNLTFIDGRPYDIDAILISHDHPDHTASFEAILTALFEVSQQRECEKKVRIFLNETTYEKYEKLLHSLGLLKGITKELKVGESAQIFEDVKVQPIKAFHKEKPNQENALGFKFILRGDNGEERKIGITGDTKVPKYKKEFNEWIGNYKDCDVVVAHLGTIEIPKIILRIAKNLSLEKTSDLFKLIDKIDFKNEEEARLFASILNPSLVRKGKKIEDEVKKYLKGLLKGKEEVDIPQSEHMLFDGIFRFFQEIFNKSEGVKLGIISEFGEELGSQRHKVARILNEKIVKKENRKNQRIITGDIGLIVNLKTAKCFGCGEEKPLTIRCGRCGNLFCFECLEKELCIKYRGKRIFYNCKDCYRPEYGPRIDEYYK